MMEELCEYNSIYQRELTILALSDIENSHVPQFPYYRISNEIAPSCKPLIVKQALMMKASHTIPMALRSSWHPESFQMCGDLLYLFPGYKFSLDEIFCTLYLNPSQRILLKTHDILQIDIMEYSHGWYANLELETKSIAILRKHLPMRTIRILKNLTSEPLCENTKR